jgi:hypothetical protein
VTARFLRVLLVGIMMSSGLICTSTAQNNVTLGPGYEKGQQSRDKLSFAMPQGWGEDKDAETKHGLYRVLVPSGAKLEDANKVITIAFQKKDNGNPGLDTLEAFFKTDLEDTLTQFPDAQFARWQPSKLDPSKVSFMGLEMYGKKKDKPSPQHFIVVQVSDGFFSVSLTVANRDDLKLPIYDDFFNSLAIESLPEPSLEELPRNEKSSPGKSPSGT